MPRNITSLKLRKFSLLSAPPAGSEFHVPVELAKSIAESLYGEKAIKDSLKTEEELVNTAYEAGLFKYRIKTI